MITYGSTTLTSYNTITNIEVYYYKSTSATSLSGGSWSTTKPTWENGKYIWQKIRTTYEGELENGQYYSESDPVNITGQQGATGTAAYSYKLNASDTTITISKTGVYSTSKITFTATSKQGTGSVNAYAGWFKIETTVNGTIWTTQYTSSANESSKEYTIPTGIIAIRCSLYQAGGTITLLDIMTIPILNDDRPIATKTYTGLIGSANDAANASFYFAKIHPDSYTTNYKVKMKVRVTAPEAYAETIDIQFGGYGSTFSSFDAYTTRTGSVGVYYINLYRATQAGISTNHKGHALGIGLRSSTNPTSTSYKRTVIIDILELDGCTIEMLDTAIKYANIDGTGSTNYYGLTEMSVGTAGQNATNNSNTHYTQYSNNVKAGTNGIKGYTLIMKDSENTWSCFYSGAYKVANTGKPVYTGGFILGKILYSAGAGAQTSDSSLDTYYNYKSGVNTSTIYDAYPVDLRYSTNCASTLTSQRPVYIVGTIENDGLFHLDVSQWYTQTEPTYADGKVYVYVGMAYSTYQVWLSTENPAYTYYDGEFILYDKAQTLQNIDSLKTSLETQIDSKVETWCQKTNPASSWTAEERPNHTGDLWYYIGESGNTYKNNTTYQYNGSTNTWSSYSANPDLFDKIDGKTAIYYGTQSSVTSAEEGDYLVDETDGSSYRWNNGAWVKVTDYKTAIDNIQIGGRNLARNTKGVIIDRTASADGSRKEYAYFDLGCALPLNNNDDISISFDLYMLVRTEKPKLNVYNTNNKGIHQTCIYTNVLLNNSYQVGDIIDKRIAFVSTITDRESPTLLHDYLEFYSDYGTNNFFRISNLKVEKGNKSTDWSPAPEDVEEEISTLRTDLQSQIDEKIQTFYQSTNPASSWTTTELRTPHDGDLWYYTGTSTSTYTKDNVYRYNASNNTWSVYSASGELFDKVDGKSTIYYGTTSDTYTGVETGDYLVDSTDGSSYRWDGSKWVKVTDYQTTITNAIDNIQIGGRNLALDSSLTGNIQKWNPTTDRWIKTIKDGHECLMCEGSFNTTATLTAPLTINSDVYGFVPYNGLQLAFSADVLLEDIVKGTTNFYLALYASGQTIDGKWHGATLVKNSPHMTGGRIISNELDGIGWTRVWYIFKYENYNWTNYLRPQFIVRDLTGRVYVKNIKIEYGDYATDWSPAPEDTTASIQAYVDTLQFQVDHMAEIYYGTAVPTLSNTPASDWDTNDIKDIHVDDLYYNTSTGYCYRFTKSGSTYSWTRIKDSDITAAATAASNANTAAGNAQTTANNANTLAGQKRRIFVAQPTPPYEVGDLWVEGSNGDIKKCKTARATGSYTASDWELASKYTDDTLASEANDKIDNLEIGGANLLRGASIQNVSFGNYKNQVTTTEETLFGCTVFKSSLKWADIGFNLRTQVIDKNLVKAGDVLTYSIWAKTDDTTSQGICGVWVGNYISGVKITDLTSEWTQYYKTFTITQAMIDGTDTIPTRFECNTDCTEGKFVYWAAPKLERGNKATDWSLASEDVQTGIDLADTANTKVDNIKKPRLGWKVNYSTYTGTNNGECYFHGYDSNNAPADINGIVEWNGTDLTITKGVWINPNTIAPYNIPILHVYRTDVEPHHADVWWDETQKKWRGYMYKTNNAPDTVLDWIWNEATDCILATYVSPSSEGAITSAQLFNPPKKFSEIPNPNVTLGLIDNLEIGSRNLLLNSAIEKTGASNVAQWMQWEITESPLIPNEDYILSFDAQMSNSTDAFYIGLALNSSTKEEMQRGIVVTDSYKRYVYYFKTTKTNINSIIISNSKNYERGNENNTTGILSVKNIKLEKGNKVTAWTPAPEDMEASIQQVQNNLDNLEIGGRNLLKWTASPKANGTYSIKNPEETDGWYAWNSALGEITRTNDGIKFTHNSSSGSSGIVIPLAFVNAAIKDVEYTLSFKYRTNLTSIGVPYLLRQSNGNINYTQAIAITPSETTWKYFTTKIQWTSTDDYNTWGLLIPYSNVINGWIEIQDKSMKLEKGSKATDWSPAPEDMQANIDTALAQSIWYATCADAGATKSATITPTTTNFVLNVGTTVNVKFDNTNTGAVGSLTLNVNNTGAKNIKYIYNKTLNNLPGADYIAEGRTYLFVYDGTYWVIQNMNYNTNTYDRRQHSNAIIAKTAITAGHLIVGDSTGYQQITSTSGGSLEFDLGYPILWAYSDIAATKTSTATYEAYPSVSFSTSGTIQDGAANKMLWLKGTIRGNIFTLASTNFLTTRIPTSDDGMYYIPLGIMSSATAGYFSSSNRIYAYIDEEFQPLDNAAALKASSAYETAVQARSEIVQTQQTLSLQIRDISVGGANLFERTKTFEGTANQSTAHDAFTEFVYKDLTVKSANTITFGNQVVELSAYQYTDLTPNMWYSFSFYAKGNVDIGFMYAGTGNAVIDSIDVSWNDNTYTGFNTTSTSSNIIWLTPTNNWQRYSVVFHIEEQDITALHRLIGLYARPVSSYTELATKNKDILITETGTDVHLTMEGNEVQICGYKLELGNKPTDWTPADNDKATYDNIISQINLSKEGIAIRADKIRLEGMITANEGFSIDEYGNMTANNGTFNGIFESYATEINENTFDLSINNGHIQFYNNDRTLTEDERYVGYIGGIRKNTSFIDGSIKNNDAITISLYNNSDFLIDAYDDTTSTPVCEVMNYVTGKPTFNFWVPARIYDGNKLQMYSRNESHGSQIEFRRYSKNTGGYVSRGSLSLHSIQDNSDISDRIYLLSKNQGNDLAGDQFLYFAGKGLRYSSSGQPMRTGYVATDKYIVTQYFSLPNLTIAKSTSQNFTIDVSRDGYTPIMCIPKVGGGQNAFYLSIYTWNISGNIATIYTHNNSSTSDVSNVTISLQVLYKLTY